jgi:hypothetical protein
MNRMNLHLKLSGILGVVLATATTLTASITPSVTYNSTSGIAGITSWPNPFTVASVSNPSLYSTAENNYGGSSLFSLGQSWTATTSGNLTGVQMAISGTAPVSFNVSLFDGGTSGWTDITFGTYTPGGNVSANLFSDTSLKTWTGYTLSGATAAVLDFSLTGADQVAITAGHQYIFEISATTNPSGMVWFRGATPNYTGGQAFRQRSPLNGAIRDMTLAVEVVPEPSVLTLVGCGVAALLVFRRPTA